MVYKKNICCFFGHRDAPQDIVQELQKEIKILILEYNVGIFLVGGYGRFDSYVVCAVKELKKKYPYIELILVTAYLSTLENNKNYIINTYDETIYPDGLEFVPQRFAITHRNKWIISQSQFAVVYVINEYGGAATALKYCIKNQLHIINIANLY